MDDIRYARRLAMRFWAKVDKTTTPDGCWTWTAAANAGGYGRIGVWGGGQSAHRVSYALFNGEIPGDLLVRHKCDNPACVRPDHLEVGTPADNAMDCTVRGRRPQWDPTSRRDCRQGARNTQARLDDAAVRAIRAASGRSQKDLAAEFGVSVPTISSIRSGKAWAHVKGDPA